MARKAPAFQLYVDDFLGGTAHMSNEEVGYYLRLLCLQWSHGLITDRHARAFPVPEDVRAYVLSEKFVRCEGGYRNERLEMVRNLSATRKQVASKGGSKTQANRQAKHEQTGVAKSNPPTPTPSPSPSSSPNPNPTPNPEGERKPSLPLVSVHLDDVEFRKAWQAWTSKIGSNVTDVTLQAQLDLLRDEMTDEATAMVQFSVSRTNCRNLITDGSHRKKLRPASDAKGGWDD